MDKSVVDFLNTVSTDLQQQVTSFVDGLKSDSSQLVRDKANDIENYLQQLAQHQIDAADLKMYLNQIKREIEDQAAIEDLAAKKQLLAIAEEIGSLLIQQLIQALLKMI